VVNITSMIGHNHRNEILLLIQG